MNINKDDCLYFIVKEFIQKTISEQKIISIFLDSGVKLQGIPISFDNQAIMLKCTRDKANILVMTSGIRTISDKQNMDNRDRGVFGGAE